MTQQNEGQGRPPSKRLAVEIAKVYGEVYGILDRVVLSDDKFGELIARTVVRRMVDDGYMREDYREGEFATVGED